MHLSLYRCGQLWLLLTLLLAVPVFAAETGSISGVVRSGDGEPLPGVSVRVTGELLPAGRSAVTGPDGTFQFLRLPPGPYQVSAELSGMGTTQRDAIVALDKDTQTDLSLSATMSEEITVTTAVPLIDVKSTEAQVNYTQEAIQELPLNRNYKGLFELAPGVGQTSELRTAPNAGGSRMDNTYLIDGLNITNPHYGDVLPNISDIDIDEVSLKRGGITAEFGRTGGMVVNAVTKSGTNQLHGEARIEYQPADWAADNEDQNVQNTIDKDGYAAALGGPIVRDRFWFYGSASFPSRTTTERRNNTGNIPDLEDTTDEYFFKLTANPESSHYLTAAVRNLEQSRDNANILANTHPSAGTNDTTEYLLGTASWTWNVTSDSLIEAKYLYDKEENSIAPLTDVGYRPAFNAARPDLVGSFTTTPDRIIGGATGPGQTVGGNFLAINNDDFLRQQARATYQTFQSWLGSTHDLRFGLSYEESSERLERRANGWGAITWNPTTRQFTATYTSQQPPHTARGDIYGIFLQDQLSIGNRTTLTAGLALNKDVYYGEGLGATPGTKTKVEILSFDWDQQIQPRLGLSFVPNLSLGDKLYAYAGRYYNTENKSLGRAASPTRIFTTRATFDANGNLISEVPAANTQTKTVDEGIDPQYTDEYILGYARPFGRVWSAEVYGQYRDVGDIMEDISRDGLGNGPFRVGQLPGAYRRYTGATLQVTRLANERFYGLSLNASYTWSKLEGNWDIDYANSLFYNSSFLQDGPGVLITDNRDGLQRGDRTHVAKIFATMSPVERVRLGSYVRYQSGMAWEARGLPDANVSSTTYVRYLEPAGSRRTDDWLNIDLLGSYEFPLGPVGLEIEGRILNVFDEQVALEVDDRLILNRAPAPNNPAFGRGLTFSSPRSYVLAAILRY